MYSVPCCPYFPSWVDPGQSSDQQVLQSVFTPIISGVKVLSDCTLNNHIKDSTERALTLWLISPITAWNENMLISVKELQVPGRTSEEKNCWQTESLWACVPMSQVAGEAPPCLTPPSSMPLYNRNEALGVEGCSTDDVDDGPSTPEVL